MKLEIQTNNIPVKSEPQPVAVNKVKAATLAAQSLPQDGKKLPTEKGESEVRPEQIEQAAQAMNNHAQNIQRSLQFSVNEESGHVVITVIDSTTNEIIRKIPEEEALQFAQKLTQGANLEILDTFA